MSVCECLSMWQIYGQLSTIPDRWMENFSKRSIFFSMKGRDLDELVSLFCVFVDVEVVCACRPSSRLCLEESSVHSMYFSMFKSSLFEHSTLHRLQPIS